jgi:hypothetical protein
MCRINLLISERLSKAISDLLFRLDCSAELALQMKAKLVEALVLSQDTMVTQFDCNSDTLSFTLFSPDTHIIPDKVAEALNRFVFQSAAGSVSFHEPQEPDLQHVFGEREAMLLHPCLLLLQ